MAFDGIVTKAICGELSNLSGARIDKIFEPNKNTVNIGMYLNGQNFLLNICIDSSNCRINLTTHPFSNPQIAPNFCMVLRKNLLGLHLKNIFTLDLERVVVIDFEGFDDVDDIISKRLIVELMGKHSNIILLDEQQIIIDSLRHIKQNNEEFRELLPHTKYSFPTSKKVNFLELSSFDEFYSCLCKLCNNEEEKISVSNLISSCFNGISKNFIEAIVQNSSENVFLDCDKNSLGISEVKEFLRKIYENIDKIISLIGSNFLEFKTFLNTSTQKSDYYLTPTTSVQNKIYPLNFFIDDFYYKKETSDKFKIERDNLLKYILAILKKYTKRLHNIGEKLKECENMDMYRIYGELITANLYQFDGNSKLPEISVYNYYTDSSITIPLDIKYSLSTNAKHYFKKYNKLKNALEIVGNQKIETEKELDYLQSVVYELESSSSLNDIYEIFDEIFENPIFQNLQDDKKVVNNISVKKLKKSKLTNNKTVSFNPIKYTVDGYTVLVGRNNKENDYLTLKYAHKLDIWFHVKDFHGSHTILRLPDNETIKNISETTLSKIAKLAVLHSKAKNSSNVPVDYCQVRYVKKSNGAKPGMVIYTHYKTIYV